MNYSENVVAFFKNTDFYIKKNPIISLRREIIYDLIGEQTGVKILDIGCGDGSLTLDYSQNNYITFLDITSEMLELVRSRISKENILNVRFENVNVFDFETETKYDIIICVGVYAHVEDILKLTRKIEMLLREGGTVIIQYTNNQSFISKLNQLKNFLLFRKPYKYNLNLTPAKEIEDVINSCNFKIIQRKSYWPISPFFSLLNKRLKTKALLYFYHNRFLSKQGPERVLLLKKAV